MQLLGCLAPTHEPKVSDHIPDIIDMIASVRQPVHRAQAWEWLHMRQTLRLRERAPHTPPLSDGCSPASPWGFCASCWCC